MRHQPPARPLAPSLVAILLLAALLPCSSARPKIGVTVKQHEPPRLGDFWQYDQTFLDPEDPDLKFKIVVTSEVDRIKTDEKTNTTKYRFRYFSRMRHEDDGGMRGGGLLDLLEGFAGNSSFVHCYLDPMRKAWITESSYPEFDEETGEPTGKMRERSMISFPATITGQGQVVEDGETKITVVSLNRKVKTPAGTFRCVVMEIETPQMIGNQRQRTVTVSYSHHRVGLVKSEFFRLEDGKRIPAGSMVLRSAELHDKDGIRSHRDYAEPEPKAGIKRDGTVAPENVEANTP